MANNTFGNLFTLTTFGESHGEAIGGIIDGCPSGLELDLEVIQQDIKTMDLEIILTKGKVYYWQVISIDSEGNSSSSQVNEFVTKE